MLDENNKTTMLAALKLIKDTMMDRMMARPDKAEEGETPMEESQETPMEEETEDEEMPLDEEAAPEVEKKTIVESFVPRPPITSSGVSGEANLKAELMPKMKRK